MVLINLILFIAFIALGVSAIGKLQKFGNQTNDGSPAAAEAALKDGVNMIPTLVTGLFGLAVGVVILVVLFFQCWAVCCYNTCCCCIVLLVPLSLVGGILCAAVAALLGALKSTIVD